MELDSLKRVVCTLILFATTCLVLADQSFWLEKKQGLIPARWWILVSALIFSLPISCFVPRGSGQEGVMIGQLLIMLVSQIGAGCVYTAVLFSLGNNLNSDTVMLFLRWLNVETIIVMFTMLLVMSIFLVLSILKERSEVAVCILSIPGCIMCLNSIPLLALIIYGWVHAPEVTTLMTVLTISSAASGFIAKNEISKRVEESWHEGQEKTCLTTFLVQPILFVFKKILAHFDKFVITALLGANCLHCSYSAGLCSSPVFDVRVQVSCTNGAAEALNDEANALLGMTDQACLCQTYHQVLVALVNASAGWSSSGNPVLLFSTTDSTMDLQYNGLSLSELRYNGTRMPLSVVRTCFDAASAQETHLGSFNATTVDCAPIQQVNFGVIIGVSIASLLLAVCGEYLSTFMESCCTVLVMKDREPEALKIAPDAAAHLVLEVPPGVTSDSAADGGAGDFGGRKG